MSYMSNKIARGNGLVGYLDKIANSDMLPLFLLPPSILTQSFYVAVVNASVCPVPLNVFKQLLTGSEEAYIYVASLSTACVKIKTCLAYTFLALPFGSLCSVCTSRYWKVSVPSRSKGAHTLMAVMKRMIIRGTMVTYFPVGDTSGICWSRPIPRKNMLAYLTFNLASQ